MRLGNVSFDGSNVMDIKIGAITWDHEAPKEKQQLEKSKYPWQEELGFKILGYRFTRSNGQLEVLDKVDAKKLNPEKVRSAISLFLSPDGDEVIGKWRANFFVHQLQQIKELIEQGISYKFISSSILFAYKNVPYIGDVKITEIEEQSSVTMIDFAHTFQVDDQQVDVNYLKGLCSLISFFPGQKQ